MTSVTKLHDDPEIIDYKGHVIRLVHREELNDYAYAIDLTTTIGGKATRRDRAIKKAKADIDRLTG